MNIRGCRWFSCIVLMTLAGLHISALWAAGSMLDFGQSVEPGRIVLPARGRQEAVVEVSACGKYAVVAKSKQGASLQLIDRMAGPGPIFGTSGEEDGRVDAILDRGTYKIVTYSHEKGEGDVTLTAHAFQELNAPSPPRLVELKPIETVLDDFQQRSYWLEIEKTRYVAIEAAGRNLSDLRLWKDGNWLLNAEPGLHTLEPMVGKPLSTRRLAVKLDPGLYLLTAYGGPSQPWSETSDEHPLYIRYGIPTLPEALRQRFEASPFGLDRWLVPESANYFRLELAEAENAGIRVMSYPPDDPYNESGKQANITKKSLPPVAELTYGSGSWKIVTITREPGKAYTLQHFNSSRSYKFEGGGQYWLSTIHSGHGEDSVDATAMLTEFSRYATRREERLSQAAAIQISDTQAYLRRFNLLDPLTLFLEVKSTGKYIVEGHGAEAHFIIEPFLTFRPKNYKRPGFKYSGQAWDLDKGFYVLTAAPVSRGILELGIRHAKGFEMNLKPAVTAVKFKDIRLNTNLIYTVYLNEQPGVRSGMILRKLPIDLREALPVTQRSGETIDIEVSIPETGVVRAIREDGEALPFSVNRGKFQENHSLERGRYTFSLVNPGEHVINYSLSFAPERLAVDTPLPQLSAERLRQIPDFPPLTAERTEFFDMTQKQRKTFLVQVEDPALYRLETTGLLQTWGKVRTRTVTSLDQRFGNGVGRNFLIQQYLREGDYQLSMGPEGRTAGHLGLKLAPVPMRDDGVLTEGVPARFPLKGGEGLLYRFTIPEQKQYRLRAIGLKQQLTMRLEDEDGWPLVEPGVEADITKTFRPGNYRLVILPQTVDSRVVTLLEAMPETVRFEGHGPHDIPNNLIGETINYLWMEPEEEDAERTPDRWRFHVPAPVSATLSLSSEMMGVLHGPGDGFPLRLPLDGNWSGTLETGDYTLEAKSLFPNNRLEYALEVTFSQLTEGHSRQIGAPADISISVGHEGPIELASFGLTDVRGRLYDAAGRLVKQNDDRTADWNFYLAGNLTPGQYRLRIDPVEEYHAETTIVMERPVEVREDALTLPARLTIEDTDLHSFPVQPFPGGAAQTAAEESNNVLLASASSDADVWLALEQERNGIWSTLGEATGRTPLLAVALNQDSENANYRIRVQSADRRSSSIALQALTVNPPLVAEEHLRQGVMPPVVNALDTPLNLVAVELERPGFFQLEGELSKSLAWAGAGGQQLSAHGERLMLAQGQRLWLMDTPSQKKIRATRILLDDERILTMALPSGLQPTVELEAHQGPVLVVAESRLGQPGIAPSNLPYDPALTAIADGSAVTILEDAGTGGARLYNAASPEAGLLLNVKRHAFEYPVPTDAAWGMTQLELSPESARLLRFLPGPKQIRLALPPRTAVLIAENDRALGLHWSGDDSLVTSFENSGDRLLLLYAGRDDAHAGVTVNPVEENERFERLDSGGIFNRYLSTAGVLRLKIELSPQEKRTGVHLKLRGADAGGTVVTESGFARRGSEILLNESGILDISHSPGPVIVWIEGGDTDPWEDTEQLVPLAPPSQLPLGGASMTLSVKNDVSSMLHLDAAVPVIARVYTGGSAGPVEVYPNGGHLEFCLPATPEGSRIALWGLGTQQLSGTLKTYTTEIVALDEGMGPEFRLAPGESRLFRFTLWDERAIGIGVSGSADIANCRLLDSAGRTVGTGVVQMHTLQKGEYFLSVDLPDDAASVELRPVLVGLKKSEGTPPDVIRSYLEQAGLKQEGGE